MPAQDTTSGVPATATRRLGQRQPPGATAAQLDGHATEAGPAAAAKGGDCSKLDGPAARDALPDAEGALR